MHEYQAAIDPQLDEIVDPAVDVYVDFSLGMGEGMRATADFNESLKNFLVGRQTTYFKVGSTEVPPKIDIDSPSANFIDLNNFTERRTLLRGPLDLIVGNPRRSAIFITDFENILEADQSIPGAPSPHPIDVSAWAQVGFRKWLTGGNRIDVFARRYDRRDAWFGSSSTPPVVNWLYTIVFTPRQVLRDEQRFAESPLAFLLETVPDRVTSEDRHFSFHTRAFDIEARNDAFSGNANEMVVLFSFEGPEGGAAYDVHQFQSTDLLYLRDDPSFEDRRLLNGVRIRSELEVANSVEFGIRVYDITQDLVDFAGQLDAIATEALADSSMVLDSLGASVSAATTPAVGRTGDAIDGVFEFTYDEASGQMGLLVHGDFVGVQSPTVYRIDVVVEDFELADFSLAMETLSLRYSGGYTVRALPESLRLAVRDVMNASREAVVYRHYIVVDP